MSTYKTALSCVFISLLCLLLSTQRTYCQKRLVITGRVVDAVSGVPVVDANVVVVGTTLGASTDSAGRYIVTHVPLEWHVLKITHIAFRQAFRYIDVSSIRDTVVWDIGLQPNVLTLPGVTATAESQKGKIEKLTARTFLSARDIEQEGAVDWLSIYYRHAAYLNYFSYVVYVDGFNFPKEMMNTLDVHRIKEVYVWRWLDAPVQYRFGLVQVTPPDRISSDMQAPTRMMTLSGYKHPDYILLINTRSDFGN